MNRIGICAVYKYITITITIRAVFKWLSKVITWLWLLRVVIGLKDSRQFFNQWEAKPKPVAPCTRDSSRASSELQLIARNCDWFITLSAPVVIGRSNCFGFGFSTVNWKPLYHSWIYWMHTLSLSWSFQHFQEVVMEKGFEIPLIGFDCLDTESIPLVKWIWLGKRLLQGQSKCQWPTTGFTHPDK